jgi:hypothetical protein
MPFQIEMALEEAPNGKPKYFIGNKETLQPRILASSSTSSTLPTGTISHFAKLILFLILLN